MKPIDFYFDFASPYAWFAWEEIQDIAAQNGRAVRHRPILLWAVLQAHGMPAPLEHKTKKDYVLHDMDRSARFLSVPFRMPDHFPTSSHLPARIMLKLQQEGDTRALLFAEATLHAYFVNNIDLRDINALAKVAEGVGIDASWMDSAVKGDDGKQLLQASNAAATEAGVWGSPYIVADDESFFGVDRLPQLKWHLARAKS